MAVLAFLPHDVVCLEDGFLIMIFKIMLNIPAHFEALSKVVFLKRKVIYSPCIVLRIIDSEGINITILNCILCHFKLDPVLAWKGYSLCQLISMLLAIREVELGH